MARRKKQSFKHRSWRGDFLAWLILLAVVGSLGWLWWQKQHPAKPVQKQKSLPAPLVKAPAQPPKISIHSVPVVPDINLVTTPAGFPRVVRDTMEAQVALARRGISPGSIDAAPGSQTRAAIAAFQRSQQIIETASLDTNTRPRLTFASPLVVSYTVTTNDLTSLQPIGKTWLEKSQQTALAYETELELVAEKGHAHPALIRQLNPGVDWTNLATGTVLQIPGADYPEPGDKAAQVIIHLSGKYLEAFDAETNLLLHCPCSIAARVEKRPVGELHVIVIAPNPNYTVDPALFPESAELQEISRKLILPPGPNNPVGVAWIGLDRTGYGMHGTPIPEQVGRTESHGCFRLANWDATYLLKLAWVGLPVQVVP